MQLKDLAKLLLRKELLGDGEVEISGMTEDSRTTQPGDLFVAFRGDHQDGHQYAQQAVDKGAVAVLAEYPLDVAVAQLIVPSTRRVTPLLAHALYGYPARALSVIGVTGTNGKTTTTMFIEQILQDHGKATGLIGSVELRASNGELKTKSITTPTTPMPVEFARVLREMADLHTDYVVMETSSHALVQGRSAGVAYRVAVFTNLTQDHLDYHRTMEAYGQAKGLLFSRLGNDYAPCADGFLPVAVLNADDAWSEVYAEGTVQQVLTYAIDKEADVRATDVQISGDGVTFALHAYAGDARVKLQMTGRFSVYNALAAATTCLALGLPLATIVQSLERIQGVPGRFEPVLAGQPYTILVDYSHTPDSLENALTTVREFVTGKVITVVGCGGDRDRTKRPIMARVATQYSDLTVLTSDNPRTEDPETILDDMEVAIKDSAKGKYVREVARAEGIRMALAHAQPGDVVLIAGKGHETYQIIGKTYHDFDDRVVAAEIVRGER
ncbi:MAG: UDP-N-acetylmuramoyl-L-alanyl-D-glutamate--2,6-diaminopimelate ligase [Firmicutes bacterium]|nr:UDP-N-acetylmuramoyl-L-alanyl-D-glutamate--2,6-diaminopimelate ligase [Bacillota bacterium]